jgi:glycerophosphoryl diester phosphodiesterase
MSFNPHSVAALADLAPDLPRGLTTENFAPEDWPPVPNARLHELNPIPDFDRVGACFVSHNHAHLDSPAIQALAQRDVPILCWTIRSPEDEEKARKIAANVTFEGYAA